MAVSPVGSFFSLAWPNQTPSASAARCKTVKMGVHNEHGNSLHWANQGDTYGTAFQAVDKTAYGSFNGLHHKYVERMKTARRAGRDRAGAASSIATSGFSIRSPELVGCEDAADVVQRPPHLPADWTGWTMRAISPPGWRSWRAATRGDSWPAAPGTGLRADAWKDRQHERRREPGGSCAGSCWVAEPGLNTWTTLRATHGALPVARSPPLEVAAELGMAVGSVG